MEASESVHVANAQRAVQDDARKALHDALNQIAVIAGQADLLAHRLAPESEHQPAVKAILRAARESARLLQRTSDPATLARS
jgi:hypothetical protein